MTDLVGLTQIAERLGVPRGTVDSWRHRGKPPEPYLMIGIIRTGNGRLSRTGTVGMSSDHEPIKIQVRDPVTDELLEESLIENDYLIICAGRCYLAHTGPRQRNARPDGKGSSTSMSRRKTAVPLVWTTQ